MKLILPVILLFISINVSGKEFTLSEPIDLPQEGINKVLQVSNGNTLLFHLRNNKAVLVFVFDETGKKISESRFVGKVVNLSALETSTLKGIYEINNEAVMFLSQELFSKESLIKVRFNINSGRAIKEDIVLESPNITNTYNYQVAHNNNNDGYMVFPVKKLRALYQGELILHVYDKEHNLKNKIPVNINKDDYDYVSFISMDIDNNGSACITLLCEKIVKHPDERKKEIAVCYIEHNSSNFTTVITKLANSSAPYYAKYTYDNFENNINLFLTEGKILIYKNGLQNTSESIYAPTLLQYNVSDISDMSYVSINSEIANEYLKANTDTTQKIYVAPTDIFTNRYGMTTLIGEEIDNDLIKNGKRLIFNMLGNISITMINSKGEEIWGTVLPKKHFLKARYLPHQIKDKYKSKELFRYYYPKRDFHRQFTSYSACPSPARNLYIIYNDLKSNFNTTLNAQVDTVLEHEESDRHLLNTDAVCYKITRDKKVEKEYLFGEFTPDKSIAVMIEGADYNENTNTYASAVQYREGSDYSIRMAWVKFDD